MKATGEVMAIDRTFGAALNKALRGLEQAGAGPLAEDPAWTPTLDYLAGRATAGDRDEPTRRRADPLDRRGAARPANRPATPSGPPPRSSCAGSSRPSDSRLWRLLGLLRRGVPEAAIQARDRDRAVVPRRDGPERRRSRREVRGDPRPARRPARTPRRRRSSRPSSGPGSATASSRRWPASTEDALRDARLGARPAARLRDGRHVRGGVRGRDAVFLLRPMRPPGSAPEAPPVAAPGRPRHRLGPGPDRAGDRVRLLRRPGRRHAPPGAAGRR